MAAHGLGIGYDSKFLGVLSHFVFLWFARKYQEAVMQPVSFVRQRIFGKVPGTVVFGFGLDCQMAEDGTAFNERPAHTVCLIW